MVLGDWWQGITEEDLDEEAANDLGYLDPIGACWPGLTPDPDQQGPVASFADQYADMLTTGQARLALVPATDGAHALTAIGWTGPLNHDNDTARFAAVVRDWQRRFGATVVGLGFDTLHLSIAAPPVTVDLALRVTAEHFAFCPDNIWQSHADTFPKYAEGIMGLNCWSFWWD